MPKTLLLATDHKHSILAELSEQAFNTLAYSSHGHLNAPHTMAANLAFNGVFRERPFGWYLLGNGYRAYNPVLMCFHSPDSWSPFGAGGLNTYGYCLADPVNRADPTGHFTNSRPVTSPPSLQTLHGRSRSPSPPPSPPFYRRLPGQATRPTLPDITQGDRENAHALWDPPMAGPSIGATGRSATRTPMTFEDITLGQRRRNADNITTRLLSYVGIAHGPNDVMGGPLRNAPRIVSDFDVVPFSPSRAMPTAPEAGPTNIHIMGGMWPSQSLRLPRIDPAQVRNPDREQS